MSKKPLLHLAQLGLPQLGLGQLGLGVVLLSACHVRIDDQEILLHHDVHGDLLELVLVNRGIMASSEDSAVAARDEIMPMLEGQRMFGFESMLHLNLDEMGQRLSEEDKALSDGVSLLSHGLFLDGEERLSGYQHVEVRNLQALLARLNAGCNALLLESANEPTLDSEGEEPEGSDASDPEYALTRALWIVAAEEEWVWIDFSDGSLVVRIPFDARDLDELMVERRRAQQEGGFDSALEAGVSDAAQSRLEDDVYTFTFRPDAEGIISIRMDNQLDQEWQSGLMDVLPWRLKWYIQPTLTPTELRALIVGD